MTTTFFISTYVGHKFGGWLKGTIPYVTARDAEDAAKNHTEAERHVGATRMARKVVPA